MADFWSKQLRGDGARPTPAVKGTAPKAAATTGVKDDKHTGGAGPMPGPSGTRPLRPPHAKQAGIKPRNLDLSIDANVEDSFQISPRGIDNEESTVSSEDAEEVKNDSVQVLVRIRPPTEQETCDSKHFECLSVVGTKAIELDIWPGEKYRQAQKFMFDSVLGPETTQAEMFEVAGQTMVDHCLMGMNSSLFAYGQTGAGKTFTVMGKMQEGEDTEAGLAPRTFRYLYDRISLEESGSAAKGQGVEGSTIKYAVKCAFLEIYNEQLTDLIAPTQTGRERDASAAVKLEIREDTERGPYVDGLTEPTVLNADEMLRYLARGAEHRHTGETRLNRESSRSHSVFVINVEKTETFNGASKLYYARINLIDLAGSERIGSGAHGGSQVTGEHFKEACAINKSLTALGRVTTELVKNQQQGAKGHVPYRDSKLTFLLQSSLGGNARTIIIANVSPSSVCGAETLSTLRFARQTKQIRNDAKVNWVMKGDRAALLREIERLRIELAGMHQGTTEPLIEENHELTRTLFAERAEREKLQQEVNESTNANKQLQRQINRAERKLMESRTDNSSLMRVADDLSYKLGCYQHASTASSAVHAATVTELSAAIEHISLAADGEQAKLCMQVAELQQCVSNRDGCILQLQVHAQEQDVQLAAARQHEQELLSQITAGKAAAEVQLAAVQADLAAQLEAVRAESAAGAAAVRADADALHGEADALRNQLQARDEALAALQAQADEEQAARSALELLSSQQAARITALGMVRNVDASAREAELQSMLDDLRSERASVLAHLAEQQAEAAATAATLTAERDAALSDVQAAAARHEVETAAAVARDAQLQQALETAQAQLIAGAAALTALQLEHHQALEAQQSSAAAALEMQVAAAAAALEAERAASAAAVEAVQIAAADAFEKEKAHAASAAAEAGVSAQQQHATLQAALEQAHADAAARLDELSMQLHVQMQAQAAAHAAALSEAAAAHELECSAKQAELHAAQGVLSKQQAAWQATQMQLEEKAQAQQQALLLEHQASLSQLESSHLTTAAEASSLAAALAAAQEEVAATAAALSSMQVALAAAKEEAQANATALEQALQEGLALATKVSEVQVSASEAKQRADAQSKLVAKHAAHVEVLTEQLAQEGKQREALTAVQQATAHELDVAKAAITAAAVSACNAQAAQQAALAAAKAEAASLSRKLSAVNEDLGSEVSRLKAINDAKDASCDALERDLHALNALHQAEQRARADAEATSAALAAELEQLRERGDKERQRDAQRLKDKDKEVRSLRDQVGLLGNSAEAHERMNARQKRAMAEMMKLIQWASSPPASAAASASASASASAARSAAGSPAASAATDAGTAMISNIQPQPAMQAAAAALVGAAGECVAGDGAGLRPIRTGSVEAAAAAGVVAGLSGERACVKGSGEMRVSGGGSSDGDDTERDVSSRLSAVPSARGSGVAGMLSMHGGSDESLLKVAARLSAAAGALSPMGRVGRRMVAGITGSPAWISANSLSKPLQASGNGFERPMGRSSKDFAGGLGLSGRGRNALKESMAALQLEVAAVLEESERLSTPLGAPLTGTHHVGFGRHAVGVEGGGEQGASPAACSSAGSTGHGGGSGREELMEASPEDDVSSQLDNRLRAIALHASQ